MKWFLFFLRHSVLAKILKFKDNVKRIKHNSKIAFFVIFIILTIILIWLALPHVRESVDNYKDEQRRADLPEAMVYNESQKLETNNQKPKSINQLTNKPINSFPEPEDIATTEQIDTEPLAGHNLHIPFAPQAPHANWDMPYQEACEEASVYMVSLYFASDDRDKIPADEADTELVKLVKWQNDKFGYYKDTTVEEVVRILKEYYKLRARILDNPTVEQIKEVVAKGWPVIVPAYGKDLPNPYFSGDGPLYHMLIIKGYTKDGKFITNDPGTRRGAEFTYTSNDLMAAIHDWNGGDVQNGASRIIVVEGAIL